LSLIYGLFLIYGLGAVANVGVAPRAFAFGDTWGWQWLKIYD
jgi:hypothetical protein